MSVDFDFGIWFLFFLVSVYGRREFPRRLTHPGHWHVGLQVKPDALAPGLTPSQHL